ncbi:SGNH/GDSL hydrolase family protein [Amphritea sp. HPY]|uniref:SGNH/GDSL hydrolase family protein n=1 Tax=Amphritea sp. HPY TaxID=3421652 RepID=UPI003D7C8B57
MKQILVYSDSLTWGIIPNTRQRFSFEQRWPGVLEQQLHAEQHSVRIIEDCLNGRRTVLDDPFKPGRNGLQGLQQRIEINSPLSLVVILLGNNDFQSPHNFTAAETAQGVATLVSAIRQAPIEPGMPIPDILIVCPPPIIQPKGAIAAKFRGAAEKWQGFKEALEQIASQQDCHFYDAAMATSASKVDGIHLDQDQHMALGKALSPLIAQLITD